MGSPFAMMHRRNPMALALQASFAPCEMPSVASLRDQASKVGRLKKLSGKGILTSGTWRDRFCLLVKSKLYYYESEDSDGGEKACGFVNLEYFDTCTEASTRMARKVANVLVIGSSDKSFFESHSGRHYFAAETLPEMKEWVNAINSAMKNQIRTKEKRTRDGSLTPGQQKRSSGSKMKSKEEDSPPGTLPRSGDRLDHVTKGRVRGPQGRRLPRKPQRPNGSGGSGESKADSVLDSDDDGTIIRDSRGRATSLSALEVLAELPKPSSTECNEKDNENEIESWEKTDGTETPEVELIYDYSSSDSGNDGTNGGLNDKPTYIQRRTLSRTGNHTRNSSVTPPPCILRKARRQQENENNAQRNSILIKDPRDKSQSQSPTEFGTLKRASSGSSLSTLTPDTYAQITHTHQNGGPFFSIQRKKKVAEGVKDVGEGINGKPRPPAFQHKRQASSVQGSPLLTNGHGHGPSHQHHHLVNNALRNGYSSHNSSPSGTFERSVFTGKNATEIQLERSLTSLSKNVESISQGTKHLDLEVASLRHDIGSIQENSVTVRGAVDAAKEKMFRIQSQVTQMEKQIASIIQEASVMKSHANELLDSAKIAKDLQTNLLEEAKSLVSFLRQSSNCIPSQGYVHPHQHYNGHSIYSQASCCSSSPCGTPVPPYCAHPLPQHSPQPQLSLRRRGKTPERSFGDEINENSHQYDSMKSRNGSAKSILSSGSSGSGSIGSGSGNNHRVSIIDPGEKKFAGSPICNGNENVVENGKISHL